MRHMYNALHSKSMGTRNEELPQINVYVYANDLSLTLFRSIYTLIGVALVIILLYDRDRTLCKRVKKAKTNTFTHYTLN